MSRFIPLFALLTAACTAVDVDLWASEGGIVHVQSALAGLDCDVWNEGEMATNCNAGEWVCDEDGACSLTLGSMTDIEATDEGMEVELFVLTAEAFDDYDFAGWEGCEGATYSVSESGNTCTVTNSVDHEDYNLRMVANEEEADLVARFTAK